MTDQNSPDINTRIFFEQLARSIQQLGSFTAEELEIFINKVKVKNFLKDAFLLKQGKVCQSFYFINRGSVRHYLKSDDEEEVTLNLLTPGDWVLDYQSFTSQKPSTSFIQAFEESEVFELEVQSFHELIMYWQSFFRIGKLLEFGILQDHLNNVSATPEKKYLDLLEKKPGWIQKFPLKYIASYLRMTPETLSRVRRKINH